MRVGIIGWRGMVGSVLMQRMREEGDFAGIEPTFFSTSAAGGEGPEVDGKRGTLQDAFDLDVLSQQEVLITCQGGPYTKDVYGRLRAQGWDGYFIDAARELRMADDSVLILDVSGYMNPWVWAPVADLYAAMHTLDGDDYRGYLVVREGRGRQATD